METLKQAEIRQSYDEYLSLTVIASITKNIASSVTLNKYTHKVNACSLFRRKAKDRIRKDKVYNAHKLATDTEILPCQVIQIICVVKRKQMSAGNLFGSGSVKTSKDDTCF